ncbi:MAG: SRPBCC family protein [Thermoleophilaceae bacterium]
MKLTNEFVVAAPLERTWPALLDVPRVARALPGANIDPEPADGAYRGTMKVKLGAVTAEYAGTAMIQDVDEDARAASFRVEARERRSHGTAAATITTRLAPEDGGTRVSVETDLEVTGRQAQLGRGIMQDVARGVLDRFAQGLERELGGDAADREQPAAASGEALDLGGAVLGPLIERALVFAAGVLVGLVVGRLVARG